MGLVAIHVVLVMVTFHCPALDTQIRVESSKHRQPGDGGDESFSSFLACR